MAVLLVAISSTDWSQVNWTNFHTLHFIHDVCNKHIWRIEQTVWLLFSFLIIIKNQNLVSRLILCIAISFNHCYLGVIRQQGSSSWVSFLPYVATTGSFELFFFFFKSFCLNFPEPLTTIKVDTISITSKNIFPPLFYFPLYLDHPYP